MDLSLLLEYVFAGVAYGGIYAVVAIGFNIIYNATDVINFAQGEFVMLGGMTAVSLHSALPLPLAILGAVALTMLVGAAIEICLIRRLESPSVLRMIIITIGVSILIREAALHLWGDGVRALPHFTGSEIDSISLFNARFSPQVLWVLGTCGLVVGGLTIFFRLTPAGRKMRACAANRTAARLCGIDTRNLVTLSFAISAGIGALAGCVLSPITQTQYDMGTGLAIKGFTVAVLGGLGSSMGAVFAGIAPGPCESFSICVLPAAFKDVISIVLMLGVLFVKPSGLLGARSGPG